MISAHVQRVVWGLGLGLLLSAAPGCQPKVVEPAGGKSTPAGQSNPKADQPAQVAQEPKKDPAVLAPEKKPAGGDEFVPLFGNPTWLIHKGQTDTWGFTDDGTVFTRRGGGGWLMTTKEYGDFDFRLEIRMSKDADTGIAFRNSLDTDPSFDGNQIQFVDEAISKRWRPETRTGSIWDVVAPVKENVTNPIGEWNEVQIIAKGRQLKISINGTLVQDVDLEQFKDRVTDKAGKEHAHPDLLRAKGHIGLQSWKGLVEFRNLRIKEL